MGQYKTIGREMPEGTIALIVIAALSLALRDYTLAAASGVLLLLALLKTEALVAVNRYGLNVGLFFLMLFLLSPLTSGKARFIDIWSFFKSPVGLCTIAAGIVSSYVGGKGVVYLQTSPHSFFAVLIGTLIGVLFFRGLPAGLLIGAGLVSVALSFGRLF